MWADVLRDAAIFGSYVHAGGAYGVVDSIQRQFDVSRPTIGKIVRAGMSAFCRKPGRPPGRSSPGDNKDREMSRLREENAQLRQANRQLEAEKKAIQRAIEYLDSLERSDDT